VSKGDRELTELEPNDARKAMLRMVIRGAIYTWAGEPLRYDNRPLFPDAVQAFKELGHHGLIVGEHYTGLGRDMAVKWGVIRQCEKCGLEWKGRCGRQSCAPIHPKGAKK
jgi:alkylation response protein AidB-like acyl-CoA dehydrogenase